jgi:hypothetical protein
MYCLLVANGVNEIGLQISWCNLLSPVSSTRKHKVH